MTNKTNLTSTLGVFLAGFLLGGASVYLLTASNNVAQSSFSNFLRNNYNAQHNNRSFFNRRGLLSLSNYSHPESTFYKQAQDVRVEDSSQGYTNDNSQLGQQMLHIEQQLQQIEQQFQMQRTAEFSVPEGTSAPDIFEREPSARRVNVGTMCRCASGLIPRPGPIPAEGSRTPYHTLVVQPPSLATGRSAKHFVMHTSSEGYQKFAGRYDWEAMPDLGVEETLPLFIGVLSYESHLSLNASLYNWLDSDLFRRVNAQDVFVQLNHRNELDDEVLNRFMDAQRERGQESPVSVLGTPEENMNPGIAISNMCRRAEDHPNGHPNGENLLMFLEKDWHLKSDATDLAQINRGDLSTPKNLEGLFRGINALAQRGVPYIRLKRRSPEVKKHKVWNCPAQGFPFECTTAHQHRWSNQPLVVSCKWFLRFMEPFALLDDPIMYGCRPGYQENRYCDWEEASQDGRIAWTNSQWIVANLVTDWHRLFEHVEVDQ